MDTAHIDRSSRQKVSAMTDSSRQPKPFDPASAGDCQADPVPALWANDDEYITESGFIERFWLPVAVGVLAGWGGLSFLMFNAFGWWVILGIFGVVTAGAAAALLLVRTGSRSDDEIAAHYAKPGHEVSSEVRFRKAA
jgi:hypothetical protein